MSTISIKEKKLIQFYFYLIKYNFKGKFIRVRSNTRGGAFTSSLQFRSSIKTQPGNYTISMYTMINCGSVGCEAAKDTISVKIKDGELGEFTEIININDRFLDDRWNNDVLQFEVKSDKIWVIYLWNKNSICLFIIF